MRFAKFWKMQVFDLSLTERMFYRDAIRTLQAWEPLKEEFAELDLIRKMLEAEIQVPAVSPVEISGTMNSDLQDEQDIFPPLQKTP
jgi:hypothetical protein